MTRHAPPPIHIFLATPCYGGMVGQRFGYRIDNAGHKRKFMHKR